MQRKFKLTVRAFSIYLLCTYLLSACAPALAPTPIPTTFIPTNTIPVPTPKNLPCDHIGEQFLSPIDGVTLVCVPAGEFLMGADNNDTEALANEKPQHKVYLDAYWMDQTEATNANFQKCVKAGVCKPRPPTRGFSGVASNKRMNYYYDAEFANYPVLIFQVQDAETYCKWAGRRLPTEAEWEKAARGTDGHLYPWGTETDCTHATFLGCTEDTTDVKGQPAGAGPYGALNMVGNVWEWVADVYAADYYAHSPSRNPTGPQEDNDRVLRGGGWHSLDRDLRVTARTGGGLQHYIDGQLGFRCAMSDIAK